jgi:hypothetical protein
MNTIVIQLTNQKALQLLKELEELNLIRLLQTKDAGRKPRSAKYAGKLSDCGAGKLHEQITRSREEWEH